MRLEQIEDLAAKTQLTVFGTVSDNLPENVKTLVLLGPLEPGFWRHFTGSEEYKDGAENPLDRWSARVIGQLAGALGAQAFFPFGGPPYQPFIQWAQDSGRAHLSPVGLLVHDVAGLMVSYRGALGFSERIETPRPGPSPCASCETKPCITACPVDAFAGEGYDVVACKADLDRPANTCMIQGCAVRRVCPVSQNYGRVEDQSAFHMRAFK
ncbi:ferredoxin [Roseovarius rhodophyticola]|uniref:Ferredoxin n=1 Tax=Roseovarius rhodophyticola TaxID=3080827 RepID=A0ABZ2TII7_9RHOB|nr:ferredoxin [Roseovarius sp. W115]MDV2929835.1 ferredoxin [Roseovarius sp. W115]